MTLQKQLQNEAANPHQSSMCEDFNAESSAAAIATTPPSCTAQSQAAQRPAAPVAGGAVIVLAATNRVCDLDEAVVRRFEARIHVPLPNAPERSELILHFLAGLPHALQSADLDHLSDRSCGWSGSDISSWCRAASMYPLRRFFASRQSADDNFEEEIEFNDDDAITIDDFDLARLRILQIDDEL